MGATVVRYYLYYSLLLNSPNVIFTEFVLLLYHGRLYNVLFNMFYNQSNCDELLTLFINKLSFLRTIFYKCIP